ncbi:uncharacterized protein LOC115338279 [Aquila chrysaetos chrysaetos]|uniref:uncharacterized protein LOC115338279 n=1 Tax=Aquila chrysaetos chrysaetos TaxID=223781 RepID=UPI001B7D3D01|nr:uncharacterized protein LOC115338279 [Aquila chrysaetos chrysaetos]
MEGRPAAASRCRQERACLSACGRIPLRSPQQGEGSRSYSRGGERERSRKKRLNWQILLAAPRTRAVMCCRKGVVMLSRCPILLEAPPPWGRQCGLSGVGSRTQSGIAVADYPRRVYLLWITWVEPLVKMQRDKLCATERRGKAVERRKELDVSWHRFAVLALSSAMTIRDRWKESIVVCKYKAFPGSTGSPVTSDTTSFLTFALPIVSPSHWRRGERVSGRVGLRCRLALDHDTSERLLLRKQQYSGRAGAARCRQQRAIVTLAGGSGEGCGATLL